MSKFEDPLLLKHMQQETIKLLAHRHDETPQDALKNPTSYALVTQLFRVDHRRCTASRRETLHRESEKCLATRYGN